MMDSESEGETFEDALEDLSKAEINQVDNHKTQEKESCTSQLKGAHILENCNDHHNVGSEFDILKKQDSNSDEAEFSNEDDNSYSSDSDDVKHNSGLVGDNSDFTRDMSELSKKLIGIDMSDSAFPIVSSSDMKPSQAHHCDKDNTERRVPTSQSDHENMNIDTLKDDSGDHQSLANSTRKVYNDNETGKLKVEDPIEWDNEAKTESETTEGETGQEDVVIEEDLMKEQESSMTEEEKQAKKEEAQSIKADGNTKFKEADYKAAVDLYTQALLTCPTSYGKERSIMYSNRAACRFKQEDYELASKDCSKALELNPNYLKALLRRAECYEKMEKLEDALEDYQKALSMDPSLMNAREACMRLPDQIKVRNEKMKDEMLGKLKELGNMVLKPFGLSTENFKLQQDPNSGSYSVNFQQQSQQNNGPPS